MSEHASVCPLDCPDTCSLTVTVEHAKIVQIRGSRANPYTDGVLCAKVPKAYPEFVHGERRLRTPLKRLLPKAAYVCLETSPYLCSRYGWEHGRIEEYRSSAAFDLVICYDVLQYLERAAAERALANFARLCRGVLYFSALTRGDFERNCDRRRTDGEVHLRSARWYRERLAPRFLEAGLGFWMRRGAPLTLWELESR